MELNEYQDKAMMTCMPSSYNFNYMMLNLVGEVGEFASKVAKAIRKRQEEIVYRSPSFEEIFATRPDLDELREGLEKEAGDILWQLAGLCMVMGWRLEDVAQKNLDKLQARKQAGTIEGNGDGIFNR